MTAHPTRSGFDLEGQFPRLYDADYLDVRSGEGEYLIDADGNAYIDVSSGHQNANIGHGREAVAEAAADQLRTLEYLGMEHTTEPVRSFCRTLASFAPDGFESVWLVSGGSLAVESVIALARQYHGDGGDARKHKFVTRRGSYHGSTLGALAATGYELYTTHMEPLLPDFPKAPRGNRYRCELCGGGGGRRCGRRCARVVEDRILELGPENVAGFMVEPVGGGMSPGERPHPEYFEEVREVCDEHDVLFVVDEILTGIGRTGVDFAVERHDVTPDVILAGKGVTAGYAPAGAVLPHETVVETFHDIPEGFAHGHTNTFHPTTAAIGDAVLEFTRRESLVDNAASVGDHLADRLEALYDYDAVGDVRGVGMLHGVEFVADRETKKPIDPEVGLTAALAEAGFENGLVLAAGGGHLAGDRGDFLVVAPPLTMDAATADEMFDRLYQAVGDGLEQVGLT